MCESNLEHNQGSICVTRLADWFLSLDCKTEKVISQWYRDTFFYLHCSNALFCKIHQSYSELVVTVLKWTHNFSLSSCPKYPTSGQACASDVSAWRRWIGWNVKQKYATGLSKCDWLAEVMNVVFTFSTFYELIAKTWFVCHMRFNSLSKCLTYVQMQEEF